MPGFHDAGDIPFVIQHLDLLAGVNMALVGIILIEQNVVRLLQAVPLQKNKRPLRCVKEAWSIPVIVSKLPPIELIDDPGRGNHVRFLRELIHKLLGERGAVEGTQNRAVFGAEENVGADALGAFLGTFDESAAQADQRQDQSHRDRDQQNAEQCADGPEADVFPDQLENHPVLALR